MKRTIVAVKAYILYRRRILLVRRSASDRWAAGEWETPGGKLEHGEALMDGLRREVWEEAGVEMHNIQLLYATSGLLENDNHLVALHYRGEAANDQVRLSEEHQDFRWASKEDLLALYYPPMLRELLESGQLDALDVD